MQQVVGRIEARGQVDPLVQRNGVGGRRLYQHGGRAVARREGHVRQQVASILVNTQGEVDRPDTAADNDAVTGRGGLDPGLNRPAVKREAAGHRQRDHGRTGAVELKHAIAQATEFVERIRAGKDLVVIRLAVVIRVVADGISAQHDLLPIGQTVAVKVLVTVADAVVVRVGFVGIRTHEELTQAAEPVTIIVAVRDDVGGQVDLGTPGPVGRVVVEEPVIVIVGGIREIGLGRGPGVKRASHLVIRHTVIVAVESVEAFVDIHDKGCLPTIGHAVVVAVVHAGEGLGIGCGHPVSRLVAVSVGLGAVINGLEVPDIGIAHRVRRGSKLLDRETAIIEAVVGQQIGRSGLEDRVAGGLDLIGLAGHGPDAHLIQQAAGHLVAGDIRTADVELAGSADRNLQ